MILGLTDKDAHRLAETHRCSCGGILVDCWGGSFEQPGTIVRCLQDIGHDTYQRKQTTRMLLNGQTKKWEEFDVVTQKPVNQTQALALPRTEEAMLQRVDEVKALGPQWAKDMTAGQRRSLAVIALGYGLDPLMEELILYQGKPMITIRGRRRKDAEAGHQPSIRFRFLTQEERDGFTEAGVLQEVDLVQVCILTTEWGNTVEAIGTVSKAQRDGRRQPVVNTNPLEMVQKRAEDRARNMAYGPLPRPQLPAGLEVIDGEGRLVEDPPAQIEQPAQPAQAGHPARAQPVPTQTTGDPPAAVPRQRGTVPPAICALHDNLRMGVFEGRRCHRLPDGSFCYGEQASKADPQAPVEGDADPDLPPSQAMDLEWLKVAVSSANLTWGRFESDYLKMTWGEWLKLGGTVESAFDRLREGGD